MTTTPSPAPPARGGPLPDLDAAGEAALRRLWPRALKAAAAAAAALRRRGVGVDPDAFESQILLALARAVAGRPDGAVDYYYRAFHWATKRVTRAALRRHHALGCRECPIEDVDAERFATPADDPAGRPDPDAVWPDLPHRDELLAVADAEPVRLAAAERDRLSRIRTAAEAYLREAAPDAVARHLRRAARDRRRRA